MSIIKKLIEALTDPQELKDATSLANKELYHFLRAVAKYGEESVLSKMVTITKESNPQLSHSEATNEASGNFNAYVRTANGFFDFQTIRQELEAEGIKQVKNSYQLGLIK